MSDSASLHDLTARGAEQVALHERAAEIAPGCLRREVFLCAVIEVSSFCRENCRYCGMRHENHAPARARAGHDELAELLIHHRPGLVTDANRVPINLTPHDLQRNCMIYKQDRFIMDEERVLSAIAAEGFSPSHHSPAEFYRNGTVHKPVQREAGFAN